MGASIHFVSAAAAVQPPVSITYVIIAIVVIVIGLIIASFFLFRNKKGNKANNSASDWQRQTQQSAQDAAGGWNQQAAPQQGAGGWNQQAAPQQGAGGWNQQAAPQQGAGGWGAEAPGWNQQGVQQQGAGWGAAQPSAQPATSWSGNPSMPNQPQQPAWGGVPNATPAANSWPGAQQPAANANQWGAPSAQPSWDAVAPVQPAPWEAAAPAQQDPWAQQAQQAQPANNAWNLPASPPLQPQGGQPSYGSNNSGQGWNGGQSFGNGQADPWGTPVAPANQWGAPSAPVSSPVGTPPWQQPAGGFGQNGAGMMPDPNGFPNSNESDQTILRTTGPQGQQAGMMGGLGMVRVEEGKEPGRIYEVRKEALSIGRSRESDIFLEDLAVSRLHASIVNMGNGNYALKDEGSANGTKVNGQLVNKNQTYPLQENDRIQLGQTVLVFGRR